MKTKPAVSAAKVVTTVSVHGNCLKVLQVELAGSSSSIDFPNADALKVLGVKALRLSELKEPAIAQALRGMVDSLPVRTRELVGLLPASEILTRYVTLPSQQTSELSAMVRYQLDGALPFSVEDCVLSIKVLEQSNGSTRVLAAAVHRPVVERLIQLCQSAGLVLTEISASGEAVGYLHRACWPAGVPRITGGWLAAELSSDGLDLTVFSGNSLVYMRQITHAVDDAEEFVRLIKETQRAYERENVGPSVQCVTLGGAAVWMSTLPLESFERELGIPVHRVDSEEQSILGKSLKGITQEFGQSISFSDLLGAACGTRSVSLDLLPLESRLVRARGLFFQEVQKTAALGLLCLTIGLSWGGVHRAGLWWQLKELQRQTDSIKPRAARVQSMAESIRTLAAAREDYLFQLESIRRATDRLSSGMTLQFLGLESGRSLVLRGTGPELSAVTAYASSLRDSAFWSDVALNSAKKQTSGDRVEFEFTLKPAVEPRKKQ